MRSKIVININSTVCKNIHNLILRELDFCIGYHQIHWFSYPMKGQYYINLETKNYKYNLNY